MVCSPETVTVPTLGSGAIRLFAPRCPLYPRKRTLMAQALECTLASGQRSGCRPAPKTILPPAFSWTTHAPTSDTFDQFDAVTMSPLIELTRSMTSFCSRSGTLYR